MEKKPFQLQQFLFGSINKKLTILFFLVAIVAPTVGIYYLFSITRYVLADVADVFYEQLMLLQTTAVLIILIIAIDATVIGFFISNSISRPLSHLYKATQELEQGKFDVRTDITTKDELAQLSQAFNKTAATLQTLDEERQQIDKAKSEFLSITSHELRTPLTPMKAQLQMLENGYFGKLTKKQKESVKILIRNAERLDRIIEDFLEVSRIEAARLRFDFKETDLKRTVEETVAFMTGFAQDKNISLQINSTKDLPLVQVDPDRVSQVLRNLIHNAIKFSPEKSTIEISVTGKDKYFLFSVKDQGAGMSPEHQISVFEPFYQIEETMRRQHGGTGLGLAICRGIVEAQQGKIWVESKVGQGSIFYFTVPMIPVVDIKPIKVLFSPKETIEKKIREELMTTLGPIGEIEFTDLKQKHALGKTDLLEYAYSLGRLSILNEKQVKDFEQHLIAIFDEGKIS